MRNLLRLFHRDESGNVLLLTGLAFLFLVGIGGAGYDLGKQQLVRQKLQQAADAAALAGAGREYGTADAARADTANAFYALNYPSSYLDIGRPLPTINVIPDVNVLVQAQANVPTSFVHTFNVNTLPSKGRSLAQIATSQNKLDVILVMDNSGSMGSTDIGVAPILAGNVASMTALCVLKYPLFAVWCPGWAAADAPAASRMNALRHVADRMASQLLNPNPLDHRIATVLWDDALITSSPFQNAYGPVRTELLRMMSLGGTNSTFGMNQAVVIGSGGFRADAVHAVILLTDGANNSPAVQNPATVAVCNSLKAMPRTLVFSIVFGSTSTNPTVRQFLSDCATGPNGVGDPKPNENLYFYSAANAAALNTAFDSIVGVLKKVRVLQ